MTNREILFRGFSKVLNQWVYGNYCNLGKDLISFIIPVHGGLPASYIESYHDASYIENIEVFKVHPESVGQFTNEKFKKQKIFENDLFQITFLDGTKGVYRVDFYNTGWGLRHVKYVEVINLGVLLISLENHKKVEIIGNTTDNPELLEGE